MKRTTAFSFRQMRLPAKRSIFLSALLFLFAVQIPVQAQAGLPAETCAKLDSYLLSIQKAYHIPGMAFTIVSSDETLFARTYGDCTARDELFIIGSQSKSFTAAAIMQLAERGLVDLNESITAYLPETRFEKNITVLNLLNQTSGFSTYDTLRTAKSGVGFCKYCYSNVNYALLGKIIEAVSGKPYAEYIAENIFKPLGMKSSTADISAQKTSKRLLLGRRNYFGLAIAGKPDFPTETSWCLPSNGFIASTPEEMGAYLQMYLRGGKSASGKQILSEKSVHDMWFKNVPEDPAGTAFYGMGWIYEENDGLQIISHGGQNENYIGYMLILPQKEIAVSFLLNQNDEFGTNNLMANAIPAVIELLNGKDAEPPVASTYVLIHLLLDLLYLAALSLSVLVFAKAVKAFLKKPETAGTAQALCAKQLILAALPFLGAAVLLVGFPALVQTPLWAIKGFVPDLFMILVASSALLCIAGILKLICTLRNLRNCQRTHG